MKKIFYPKKGFTLVELLVVIAIIGILAAVVMPKAFMAIEKSKVSRTLSDLKSMRTAALQFYADVGFFPGDVTQGKDPGLGAIPNQNSSGYNSTSITSMGLANFNEYITRVNSNWQGPYLDFPLTKKTAWGGQYDYECWGPGVSRTPNTIPNGIYVTIHGIPEKSAKMLVDSSPFKNANDTYVNDDITNKKKVCLKICDWQN